jgi:hypothetical protein
VRPLDVYDPVNYIHAAAKMLRHFADTCLTDVPAGVVALFAFVALANTTWDASEEDLDGLVLSDQTHELVQRVVHQNEHSKAMGERE